MPKPVNKIPHVERRLSSLPLIPGKPWVFPKTFVLYGDRERQIANMPLSDRYYIRDITASHYSTVAREVNRVIDEYNKWADLFNEKLHKMDSTPSPSWNINFPGNSTLTEPFGWLKKALDEVETNSANAIKDYERYWDEYDKEKQEERRLSAERRKRQQREQRDAIQKSRFEDIKAMTLGSFNTLSAQIVSLDKKINQLDFDIRKKQRDKDSEFSLFRSELVSQIPNQNLNVSRVEHDEDIAQLNETLQGIKSNVDKNAKKTDDSIAMLQKKVNVSINKSSVIMADISGVKGGIEKLTENVRADRKKAIGNFLNDAAKIDVLSRNQRNQSDEIDHLRKDLQALGGEAREFIDNTKRQEQAMKAKVAKRESVVTRTVKKAAFPDLTKRPWLRQSVIGRFFQLANQW